MEDMNWAEHGDIRVGAKRRTTSDVTDVVVTLRRDNSLSRLVFEGPDLVFCPMQEGGAINWEEEALISYSSELEEVVSPIFFALAKLFGMDTDAKRARMEGQLFGENKVLWKWVDSLPLRRHE